MPTPTHSEVNQDRPADATTKPRTRWVPPLLQLFVTRVKHNTQLIVKLIVTAAVTFSLLAILVSMGLLFYALHDYRSKGEIVVSSTPAGQVQTVSLSGGLWIRALVQTEVGFYSLREGVNLPKQTALTLELRANAARYLCDAQHHCVALL